MNNLGDMIWIELRKVTRSNILPGTTLGSLFVSLGIAFLVFIAKHPELSQNLGLIAAKGNLMAYASTDWSAYLGILSEVVAAGGLFLFILVISWMFGREFADGTLKDMLAVPVPRSSILLAKFIVVTVWCVALTIVIMVMGLVAGALINLPGASSSVILQASTLVMISACLAIVVVTPFALFASMGRGYLLPLGLGLLMVFTTNLVVTAGLGEYFPWSVPGLFAQGKIALAPISYWIVACTGLAGMLATYLWWKYADQSR